MNKQFIFICTCLAAFILPLTSHAVIYKHVDADGRITYSNVKIKGAKKVYIEPADTSFGTQGGSEERAKPATKKSPSSFPKVDDETQKNRDASRKQILLSELESEKKALEAAKEAYKQGESNPEVFRKFKKVTVKNKNGTTTTKSVPAGTGRNVAKYQEKIKGLQETVDSHQRNIELLEKEISNLN
ncbi:MAG: DUF4124 domain-containing protein [Methylophilaceae bacterium]